MVIDTFDSWGNSGKQLVGYGVGGIGITLQKVAFAKDNDAVAFVTSNLGDIYEAHIHTYTTYNGSFVSVDKNMPTAVAETTVKTVGIAHRNNGYARVARGTPTAVIADGVACGNFFYLRDTRNQTTDLT